MRRKGFQSTIAIYLLSPFLTIGCLAQIAVSSDSAGPSPTNIFTNFDVAGAEDTNPVCINANGEVAGFYQTSTPPHGHGFLRLAGGGLTTFDVPNATSTEPTAINSAGRIIGSYGDAQYNFHGFSRASSGKFGYFDAPGALWTLPSAINDTGQIVGGYTLCSGCQLAGGFLRDSSGTIITFAPPGAVSTAADGINSTGVIVGSYWDGIVNHGYLRDQFGNFHHL